MIQIMTETYIVEYQAVVAISPRVSDARVLLHQQSGDAHLNQPSREHEPILTRADNQHSRISVSELLLLLAVIHPVAFIVLLPVKSAKGTSAMGSLLVSLDLPDGSLSSRERQTASQ